MSGALRVVVAGAQFDVPAGGSLTFGRGQGCTVVLDPDDVGISRVAGSVQREGHAWWVTNHSASRPLAVVVRSGLRSVLAPGRRLAVDHSVTVVVEGQVRRHALQLLLPDEPLPVTAEPPPGLRTDMGSDVTYTDDDRRALVALFAGYLLEFPRDDPHPRSYANAAARLGWPRSTLVKRIEHLRDRLTRNGVPNLVGDNALEALAEHVLTTGVITRDDLSLLPPR